MKSVITTHLFFPVVNKAFDGPLSLNNKPITQNGLITLSIFHIIISGMLLVK